MALEKDKKDEVLVPLDYKESGVINITATNASNDPFCWEVRLFRLLILSKIF